MADTDDRQLYFAYSPDAHKRAGDLVRSRREDIGLRQADVDGVSTATLTKIENGIAGNYRRSTFRKIENALTWEAGSIERVLSGSKTEPELLNPPALPFGSEPTALALALKSFREARNIGQRALSELAGVSQQAVSRWETGVREPTFGNLMTVLTALGASRSEAIELFDAGDFDAPEGMVAKFPRKNDASSEVPRTTDERLDAIELALSGIKAQLSAALSKQDKGFLFSSGPVISEPIDTVKFDREIQDTMPVDFLGIQNEDEDTIAIFSVGSGESDTDEG